MASCKDVDEITKLIIFGYIRDSEKLLKSSQHKLFHYIPPLITSICILYYNEPEQFEIAGDGIVISDDKTSIKKDEYWSWHNTSYGTLIIPSTNNCK